MQILAKDTKDGVNKTSGVDKYYYYIQEITDAEAAGEYTTLTAEQLELLSKDGSDATKGFVAVEANGSKKVTLQNANKEKNYVIYARWVRWCRCLPSPPPDFPYNRCCL